MGQAVRVLGSETLHLGTGTPGRRDAGARGRGGVGGNGRPSEGAVRLLSIQNPWDRPLQGQAAQPSTSSCCFHLRRRGKEKAQTQRSALLREASGQGRRPGGSQPQLTPTATQGCAEDAPATRCPPARQVPGAAPLWQGYGRRNKGHCSHQPPHQPLRRPQRPELPGGSSSLGGEAGRGRVAGAESRGSGESRRLKSREAAGASSH